MASNENDAEFIQRLRDFKDQYGEENMTRVMRNALANAPDDETGTAPPPEQQPTPTSSSSRTGNWYQDDQLTIDTALQHENEFNAQQRAAAKAYEEASSMRNREAAKQYSTLDLFNAAFSRENTLTSAIQYQKDIAGVDNMPQEGYDVMSDLGDYAYFADKFIGVRNPRRAQAIKNSIDRQKRNNEIIEVHGLGGAAVMVGAGLGDPLTLAGLLTPVGAVGTTAGAISVAGTAAKSAAIGAGFMALSEAGLQASQDLRTVEESALNVVTAALMDGILGGVAARVSPAYKASRLEAERYLSEEPVSTGMTGIDGQEKGVGAQQAVTALEGDSAPATGNKLFRHKLFEGKYNPLAQIVRLTPQGRLLTSENQTTRALTQELTDVNGAIIGDYTPTSVESMVRLNQSRTDSVVVEYKNLQAESKVNIDEFNTQVNNYLRYNETPSSPQALIAAKKIRKLQDDIWQKAVDAKLEGTYRTEVIDGETVQVPLKSTDAEEYFTRMFDQRAIRENPQQFIDSLMTGMRRRNEKIDSELTLKAVEFSRTNLPEQTKAAATIEKLAPQRTEMEFMRTDYTKSLERLRAQRLNRVKAKKDTANIDAEIAKLKGKRAEVDASLAELKAAKASRAKFAKKLKALESERMPIPDDMRLREAASDVYNKLVGIRSGESGATVLANSLKARSLGVDDADIDAFLVKDIPSLIDNYNRTVGNRAELAARAGDGDYMWEGPISALEEQYKVKAEAAAMAGNAKEAARLQRIAQREATDLRRLRDRLLGLDQQPSYNDKASRAVVSGIRTVRNWNTSTMLGGVMISSLPEMSRQVAQYGVKAVLKGQGRAMKALGLTLNKLPKDDLARLASASARSVNNGKWATMADAFNEPAQSGIEAASRLVSEKLMMASGLQHFDTNMRMISAHVMNDKLTKSIMTNSMDLKAFKKFGFEGADLDALKKEIKKHGTKDADGLYNMNVDQWGSRYLVEKMEAAILKEANRITTSAGVGDRPLFMSTELGKTMLQYRTFGLASINRITIPLMQGDASQITKGLIVPAVVAAGSLMFRRALQGREAVPETVLNGDFDDPESMGYFMDVVNYAGWANIIPDAMLTADKGFDTGVFSSTKFRNRDKWGLLLGPTAGSVSAAFNAANAQTGVDSRLRSMRKLMPFQNLFYVRRAIDEIERATAKGLGGSGMYVD